MNYLGPDVPRTSVRKIDDSSFESVLNDNANLKKLLDEYDLPRVRMLTVKSGGIGNYYIIYIVYESIVFLPLLIYHYLII